MKLKKKGKVGIKHPNNIYIGWEAGGGWWVRCRGEDGAGILGPWCGLAKWSGKDLKSKIKKTVIVCAFVLQWPTWAHKCNLPLFTKKRLRVSWIKRFPLENNDWLNTGVHFLSLSLTFPQNSLAASKGHRLVCDICALKKHNSPLSQRFLNVHDDLHNRYCRGEDEGSFSLCLEKTKNFTQLFTLFVI